MRIYAAFPQPASQPEAIAPSLVRHGNPGDRPSGSQSVKSAEKDAMGQAARQL
jgi:hypothetical protein